MHEIQIKKMSRQSESFAWSGTSVDIPLDGDYPIVGLAIHLDTGAMLTFETTIDGTDYTVFSSGTALAVDQTTELDAFCFLPELSPARHVKITASISQSTATVIVRYVS